jgi:hypothetical protein
MTTNRFIQVLEYCQIPMPSTVLLSTNGDITTNLFNELRYGILLCQILNSIQPGLVSRVNECKSTFAALENLAGVVSGNYVETWLFL